ncbi:S8 family peptidase [Halocatena marina]|nr:S8 family peptidase [Halocatena marina]
MNRRTFLQLSGFAGIAGFTGFASAVPERESGSSVELLVGTSATTERPHTVVTPYLPNGTRIVHENDTLGYVAVEFPEQSSSQVYTALKQASMEQGPVSYVEPNGTHRALYEPNDPLYSNQNIHQMINTPAAWDETLGDSDVTIAVIDQGVAYGHPDLQGNARSDPGHDFVDDDSDPAPDTSDESHGSHIAGIAAAGVDNGTGIAGIGNSTLLSVRALDEMGSGAISDIADGIQWAADQGADVINLSLGGGGPSQTMDQALAYAVDNGALPIAAAGGSASSEVAYPAANSKCLAVSALDSDRTLASYSNYGEAIELAAPGTNVLSTVPGSDYEVRSGTSMAASVVSGVAGLTLSQWDLTNSELRAHLKDTTVNVGIPEDEQGSGLVDAGNAVTTPP